MARWQKYIDKDVLTAARERLVHIYDQFDTVVVQFSGGKDSLAVLHLAWDEAQKRGIKRLPVCFRDEELIPDSVISFVDEYRQKDWIDLQWIVAPMLNQKFVLGQHMNYVQWDHSGSREFIRPIPSFARVIKLPVGKVLGQHVMDDVMAEPYKGKVAFLTGIRTSESIVRLRSCLNKLNDNYICASSSKRVHLCKPIYDWQQNDVFKYFYDENIRYCPIYDNQFTAGTPLRVSTPLHPCSAKRIGVLRETDPDFYQRLIDVFPEMLVQDRYWDEYDANGVIQKFGERGWDGVEEYILRYCQKGAARQRAMERLKEFRVMSKRDPVMYNPFWLMVNITKGAIKRVIQPDVDGITHQQYFAAFGKPA